VGKQYGIRPDVGQVIMSYGYHQKERHMNTRYRECDVIHLGGKCFFMMGLFVDLEIIEKINEKSNIQTK
tara:strand:- start:765 stop:971 length:207 start_codon:yes stop_codon:yes gene_type:complete